MQEQTVRWPKTDMPTYRNPPGIRFTFTHAFQLLFPPVYVPTHWPHSRENVAISRRPHQRGSLTTQQGPDAIAVEEGLFRPLWAVPGGVCGGPANVTAPGKDRWLP